MTDGQVYALCAAIVVGCILGGHAAYSSGSSPDQNCQMVAPLASDRWKPDPDKMLEYESRGLSIGNAEFNCALEASLWAQFVQASAGDQLRADKLLEMWRRRHGRCPRAEQQP